MVCAPGPDLGQGEDGKLFSSPHETRTSIARESCSAGAAIGSGRRKFSGKSLWLLRVGFAGAGRSRRHSSGRSNDPSTRAPASSKAGSSPERCKIIYGLRAFSRRTADIGRPWKRGGKTWYQNEISPAFASC